MSHNTPILDIIKVTHDVKCFRLQKPAGYVFTPGQAADVSINKPGFEEQLRPFTFTALNDKPYLEFTIKRYPDHHGVTDRLHQLEQGDELLISDPWGAIEYKGPGYFIAGGAGVTPFIAILRSLHNENKMAGNTLFFSNKTSEDIIYRQELAEMHGLRCVFILTREPASGYETGHIDQKFIVEHIRDFKKQFYVCGPDKMVSDLIALLGKSGASPEALVFEK